MKTLLIIIFLMSVKNGYTNNFSQSEIDSVYSFLTDKKMPKPDIEDLDTKLKVYSDLQLFLNSQTQKGNTLLFKLGEKDFFTKLAQILAKSNKASFYERFHYLGQFLVRNYIEELTDEINNINSSHIDAFIILKRLVDLLDQCIEYKKLTNEKWYKSEFAQTKEELLKIESYLNSTEWELPTGLTKIHLPHKNINKDKKVSVSSNNNNRLASFPNKTKAALLKLFKELPLHLQEKTSPKAFLFNFIAVEAQGYTGIDLTGSPYHQPVSENFEMMEYEVSQLLFYAIMKYNHSRYAPCKDLVGKLESIHIIKGIQVPITSEVCPFHPVSLSSYINALDFVEKINQVLNDGYEYFIPTDAQWGLALRESAQEKTPFFNHNGQNRIEKYAHIEKRFPTAGNDPSYLPNSRGFYHLLGNAREYVSRNLAKVPAGGSFTKKIWIGNNRSYHGPYRPYYWDRNKTVYYLRGGGFSSRREEIGYGNFHLGEGYQNYLHHTYAGLRLVRKKIKYPKIGYRRF